MVRHYRPDPVPRETSTGVTVESRDEFKRLLGIPRDLWVVAGVTIGTAAPDPRAGQASSRFRERRRPLEEVIRWERW